MRAFYTDRFVLPLPRGHRFPMTKYRLLRREIERACLLAPGLLLEPDAVDDRALLRVHTPAYLEAVTSGSLDRAAVRRIGFPWSPALVERSRRSVGGTIAACRAALVDGAAVNLAGGTHHAFADRGAGFCVLNDIAVASRTMQAEGRAERILVVDCDVHQGDGTAAIFTADPTVFTLSIHGARNFPLDKKNSDIDIDLPDQTGDDSYLGALESSLETAFDAAAPQLVIYVAGADPWHGDRLGRLALTKRGLLARDAMVLSTATARGAAVATVMAGGYAERVEDIVAIHFGTIETAARFATGPASRTTG